MQRTIRALASLTLISLLAACVITPPPRTRAGTPRPTPREAVTPRDAGTPHDAGTPRDAATPHDAAAPRDATTPPDAATLRYGQVNERIDNLNRRIDGRVTAGFYAPADGSALHHRLDVIREEGRDIAAQHGGGLSGDEQGVLNQELDAAARAIGE
jgi:hypothetical protein